MKRETHRDPKAIRPRHFLALLAAVALVLSACHMSAGLMNGGGFGATAGGVQDMGLAREMIDRGIVPPPEAFVVEGMFSEHDLPLDGAPCTEVLCLRAAPGLGPTLEGEASGWLQVGMSSTIDPASFERLPQTLVMAIDASCSMTYEYMNIDETYPTPMELSKSLLHAIAGELGPADRVAIVTYGSEVRTELGLTPGNDPAIGEAIDAVAPYGVTRMEEGMRLAYDVAREAGGDRPARVMVFTDLRPNVGATEPTEFEVIAREGADDGIGLTVYGMGIGLGQEVMNAISHLRGGNAFTLFRADDVDHLMEDSWPWMVSPIAYDMAVEIEAAAAFRIVEGFGFPAGVEEARAGFEVASVFLSRRRGGLLLRAEPTDDAALESLSLSGTITYTTPQGASVTETVEATIPHDATRDDRGHWYAQSSVGRTVSLAILVSGMRSAVELYRDGDAEAAVSRMEVVLDRLVEDADALADEALASEIPLAEALLELLRDGAPMNDPYYEG
jgi:Ca-activated chloride channel homolog